MKQLLLVLMLCLTYSGETFAHYATPTEIQKPRKRHRKLKPIFYKRRCIASTTLGFRCKNNARKGSNYCTKHKYLEKK